VDFAKTFRNGRTARNNAGKFIGSEFALPGHEINYTQKKKKVPIQEMRYATLYQSKQPGQRNFGPKPRCILQSARDGGLRSVDEGAEFGVPTVIVSKFVGENATELGNIENGKERQTYGHDAATAKTENPAAVGNPGIHRADQVNLFGNRFVEISRQLMDFLEELRMSRRL